MATKTRGTIRVGLGGWIYEPWRGTFYPDGLTQKRELEFASRKLSSIEINATFYGCRSPRSFAKWHDETPDDFVFALKGLALHHQPARPGERRRGDRALLRQRGPGAEGQARPDQLAARADQAARPRRRRGLPAAAAAGPRRPHHPPRARGAPRQLPLARVRRTGPRARRRHRARRRLRAPADRRLHRALRLCAHHGHSGRRGGRLCRGRARSLGGAGKDLAAGGMPRRAADRSDAAIADAPPATSSSSSSAATRSATRRRRWR